MFSLLPSYPALWAEKACYGAIKIVKITGRKIRINLKQKRKGKYLHTRHNECRKKITRQHFFYILSEFHVILIFNTCT